MTGLKRAVTRQTAERERTTGEPLVVRLEAGGRLIRIRPKGTRTWFTVTFAQLYQLGAQNAVAEARAERKRHREEKAAVRAATRS